MSEIILFHSCMILECCLLIITFSQVTACLYYTTCFVGLLLSY